MEEIKTFYALVPSWAGADRFYKIYVTKGEVYGVLLAKQIYDEESATDQLIRPAQIFGFLARMWADRILRKRQEREKNYDAITPGTPEFMNASKHNFRISKNEIIDVQIEEKQKTFWTLDCHISGIMRIRLIDSKEMKFILVGKQDIEAILAAIK